MVRVRNYACSIITNEEERQTLQDPVEEDVISHLPWKSKLRPLNNPLSIFVDGKPLWRFQVMDTAQVSYKQLLQLVSNYPSRSSEAWVVEGNPVVRTL